MYPCLKMREFCLKPGQSLATDVRSMQFQAFEIDAAKRQQPAEARIRQSATVGEVQPFQAVQCKVQTGQTLTTYYITNVCYVLLLGSQRPEPRDITGAGAFQNVIFLQKN